MSEDEKEKHMDYEGMVSCEYCLKNIPPTEAYQPPEAKEYVLYFCGMDCYDVWHKKSEKAKNRSKPK